MRGFHTSAGAYGGAPCRPSSAAQMARGVGAEGQAARRGAVWPKVCRAYSHPCRAHAKREREARNSACTSIQRCLAQAPLGCDRCRPTADAPVDRRFDERPLYRKRLYVDPSFMSECPPRPLVAISRPPPGPTHAAPRPLDPSGQPGAVGARGTADSRSPHSCNGQGQEALGLPQQHHQSGRGRVCLR